MTGWQCHVWMASGLHEFCACASVASCRPVCGLEMRHDMAAGSDGNVDRDLIIAAGWQCPDDPLWLPSIAGLTGIAITHVHPRKLGAAVAVSGSSRQRPAAEVLLARHQRPADACRLVGQSHRHHACGGLLAGSLATHGLAGDVAL